MVMQVKHLNDAESREPQLLTATADAIVRLSSLVKSYKLGQTIVPALRGLSLELNRGEFTAVIGASGSGKSTLARVLLGIWPQSSGDVLLDGQPILNWDRMELGPHIGYLPQDIELFDGTIAENIARAGEVVS
jgi:ATP-binding cassette subfamily C exporter for protease/lipase